MNKYSPAKVVRMKKTPGKGPTIYGVSVGGWTPRGQWWECPRPASIWSTPPSSAKAPPHSTPTTTKPPFILCNEYPLISRALENCIKQQHHLTKRQLFITQVSLRGKWEWTVRYQSVYLVDALIMIQAYRLDCVNHNRQNIFLYQKQQSVMPYHIKICLNWTLTCINCGR